MINQTDLKFIDISSEEERSYRFPGNEIVVIKNPLFLNISENGHRVFDEMGMSYYIPKGWIQLSWKAKKGSPNFIK